MESGRQNIPGIEMIYDLGTIVQEQEEEEEEEMIDVVSTEMKIVGHGDAMGDSVEENEVMEEG
eukprot:445861-Hanusia_phi.AAC.1